MCSASISRAVVAGRILAWQRSNLAWSVVDTLKSVRTVAHIHDERVGACD